MFNKKAFSKSILSSRVTALCSIIILAQIAQAATDNQTKEPVNGGVVPMDINGYYPLSGNSNIDVQSYELHFSDIDYTTESLTASAVITIKAVSNLTAAAGIYLDFAPPGGNTNSISSLTVDGVSRPFSLETCSGGSTANYETCLEIIPASTITSGTEFTVALAWSGHPNEESTSYGDGWGMNFKTSPEVVTTMNQPNSAHLWFPCNDMPEDKATCDIYGTVDLDQWAISVGELANVTTNGSERTFHWHTDFNVSPYLIAFNAGDYTHVPDVGGAPVPVDAWYYDGSYSSWESGAENARDFINTYTNMYGPYPFEKYSHVQFWNTGAAYMEHQTISSMISGNNTQYTAHELAHQWWGGYVTCETWNDLWLNEAFAVYSEHLRNRGKTLRDELANSLRARNGHCPSHPHGGTAKIPLT
ncbi:MAG: M1 family aminopeptidase [Kiritimatiellae bacterium]|jgi:aminopeptidase N|nr:M1 family aminopeptidase [Kiritimatiellia bacterium]